MAPRRNDVEYFRNVEGYFCLSIYCTVRAAKRRHTPGSPTPACACILLSQSQQFSAIIRQDLTVAKCPFFLCAMSSWSSDVMSERGIKIDAVLRSKETPR